MTGDLPAAALRLLSALPVHTHQQPTPPPPRGGDTSAYQPGKPKYRGTGGQNRKRVTYEGIAYASIREAAEANDMHHATMRKRLGLRNKGKP